MAVDTVAVPASLLTKIKSLLVEVDTAVSKYYAHLSSQAIAWTVIATHDVSKWETAISVLGTSGGVGIFKRIQTWLSKA